MTTLETAPRPRTTLYVVLLYLCLTIIMTWPLAARLTTHIPGDQEREDHWMHQWTFWHVEQSLLQGKNPLYADEIFYPRSISLASHNVAWLDIAVWLPLRAVVGRVAAYNLLFFATYVLNGLAVYWLAREVTGRLAPAVVAGIIAAFWPYTLSHFDHPNLILTAWIPLALLFLRRVLAGGGRRDVLLTALFISLTGFTRWQLLPIAAVFLGLYIVYAWLTEPAARGRPVLGRLLVIFLLAAVVLLPAMLPAALPTLGGDGGAALLFYDRENWQTDLVAYFLPSRYHPLWQDIIRPSTIFNNLRDNKLYTPFLGFTTTFLALLGIFWRRRQALFWLIAAAVLVVLALGAVLRINGVLYPAVPMPFDWLEELVVFRLLRRPDRFNILLGVPLALLAAGGIIELQRRLRRWPAAARLLPLVAALLILFESLVWPYPTVSTDIVPAFYQTLAAEPGDFAIVDLPLDRVPYKFYMFYQISHGRPLVEGRLARVPPDAYTFIDSVGFLADVRAGGVITQEPAAAAAQLAQLSDAGVRFIIIHKEMAPDQWPAWRDWLARAPFYEDERLLVFKLESGD